MVVAIVAVVILWDPVGALVAWLPLPDLSGLPDLPDLPDRPGWLRVLAPGRILLLLALAGAFAEWRKARREDGDPRPPEG